ncbi:3-galactosyl-N-acetylglucosaminide 4-alpha-L-fucosyltransferase FUT3-like [Ascaphus truei]|uniref:3-galactosyl-N-acetylglucosaminide 4-alpha-L-fucosyltransferase FUT3-like n=1 Tax=Ascaphus truei TaxID=8439 RepID=UPI003F59B614
MEFLGQSSILKKIIFFFILQAMLSFVLFASFGGRENLLQEPDQSAESLLPLQEPKEEEPQLLILLWTWPFNDHFPLNQCPKPFDTPGCFFTDNRSLYSSANAIIIHHRDACNSREQLPQIPRPAKQYWIWFNLESPTHSPNLAFMDKLINLSMSYRLDSDIFTPYGWLEKHGVAQKFTIPVKTKLVAWVISNWNPRSRRVQYYEELKKHIHIDMYGANRLPLPRAKHIEILSTYKFYLAFENTIHQDYITEKLWYNSLTSGTVPVVLGPPRENYERFIPPDSFIHVDDFSTAQELADYLLELDKDDKRYQQYFNWRSRYRPVGQTDWTIQYCKACKVLKEAPPYRTLPSIAKWYT